jgi:hypothetical protein
MSTKKSRQEEVRRLSAQFPRLIEWSEEDGCYVGSAPPLVGSAATARPNPPWPHSLLPS